MGLHGVVRRSLVVLSILWPGVGSGRDLALG